MSSLPSRFYTDANVLVIWLRLIASIDVSSNRIHCLVACNLMPQVLPEVVITGPTSIGSNTRLVTISRTQVFGMRHESGGKSVQLRLCRAFFVKVAFYFDKDACPIEPPYRLQTHAFLSTAPLVEPASVRVSRTLFFDQMHAARPISVLDPALNVKAGAGFMPAIRHERRW